MRIFKDKLSDNYIYPCSISEIREFLKELPENDINGIKSIRLSNQLTNIDGGFHHDGRLEIIYFVDKNLKKPLKSYPSERYRKEWERFGGYVKYIDKKYYVCWALDNLKRYIKFILFHEVGHNIFHRKHGKLGSGVQEEKFCTDYAMNYLQRTQLTK